jgi:hypothetical protein
MQAAQGGRYISLYRQRAIGLMKVKGPGDRPP